VSFEGGRVSVQGVQGVMMINGILARMIFEANKPQARLLRRGELRHPLDVPLPRRRTA
jgi:hypothetical protein